MPPATTPTRLADSSRTRNRQSTKRKGPDSEPDADSPNEAKVVVLGSDTYDSLKERINKLELQLSQKELASKEQLDSLTTTNRTLTQENRKLTQENRKLGQDNRKLTLDNRQLENNTSGHRWDRAYGSKHYNTPDYHKSLRERDKTKWKDKEKEVNNRIMDQDNQIQAVTGRGREHQDIIGSLQREVDKLKAERDELKGPACTMKENQAEEADDRTDLQNRLQRSEEARTGLEQRIAQLEDREAVTVTPKPEQLHHLEERVSELVASKEQLAAQISSRDERIAALEHDHNLALQKRDDALSRKPEKEEMQLETVRQQRQQLEDSQTAVTRLEKECRRSLQEAQSSQIEQLAAHLESRDLEIRRLQLERDEARSRERTSDWESLKQSLVSLESSYGSLSNEHTLLEHQLKAEKTSYDGEIARLQQAQNEALRGRDEALSREQDNERKLRDSEDRLTQKEAKLKELEQSSGSLQLLHEKLADEHSNLQRQLEAEHRTASQGQEVLIRERDDALASEQAKDEILRAKEGLIEYHEGKLKALEESIETQEAAHKDLLKEHALLDSRSRAEKNGYDEEIARLQQAQNEALRERDEALSREQDNERKGQEVLIRERDDALASEQAKDEILRAKEGLIEYHEGKLKALEESIETQEAAHKDLLKEHALLDSRSRAEKNGYDEEIARLQQAQNEALRERDEALSREQDNERKLCDSEERLTQQTTKLAELEQSSGSLQLLHEKLADEHSSLQRQLEAEQYRARQAGLGSDIISQRQEVLIRERDDALASERAKDAILRAKEELIEYHEGKLKALEESIETQEVAHKDLLKEHALLDSRSRAEKNGYDEEIARLQQVQNEALREHQEALSREQDNERKLRDSEEKLEQREMKLEELEKSLGSLQSLHDKLVNKLEMMLTYLKHQSTLERSWEFEIANRNGEITRLQHHEATLIREREEASAREHEMKRKLHSSEQAASRQMQELQALREVQQQGGGHQKALNDLRSQNRTLQAVVEEKDKAILDLKVTGQRIRTELSQASERTKTVQSHYNELLNHHVIVSKEGLDSRNDSNQALYNRLLAGVAGQMTQVFAGMRLDSPTQTTEFLGPLPSGSSWPTPQNIRQGPPPPQVSPDTSEENTTGVPLSADGPAHPSEENFLVNHFHRETLSGAKIMKETKRAQKTLRKYKLVSPIPTASNEKGKQASNPKKQTPWQKKTGRSPYVKQQHRDVAPSPSPSSSGSSSTDGEGAE
ncbi:hypothetical protein AAF712_016066 [Marasmius tenuissimus]|uniref:Uncharacterized protein n=1 Tax=Marasmius tenuissimus TaxID=585030 RepID=A0ABR2ZA06_9AGAR